jgi:hypothetical protein
MKAVSTITGTLFGIVCGIAIIKILEGCLEKAEREEEKNKHD